MKLLKKTKTIAKKLQLFFFSWLSDFCPCKFLIALESNSSQVWRKNPKTDAS
jgi:hypothetical protein